MTAGTYIAIILFFCGISAGIVIKSLIDNGIKSDLVKEIESKFNMEYACNCIEHCDCWEKFKRGF